jgi:hypothetical protein
MLTFSIKDSEVVDKNIESDIISKNKKLKPKLG